MSTPGISDTDMSVHDEQSNCSGLQICSVQSVQSTLEPSVLSEPTVPECLSARPVPEVLKCGSTLSVPTVPELDQKSTSTLCSVKSVPNQKTRSSETTCTVCKSCCHEEPYYIGIDPRTHQGPICSIQCVREWRKVYDPPPNIAAPIHMSSACMGGPACC